MEKSSITARMSENDVLGKLKTQLDDAQKTAGRVEQHLAEARSILLAYTRKNSNLQYTNFCDMVLESSKNAEKLTEKLRRLTLEVTLDAQKYEDYKSDLVLIHGIDITFADRIQTVPYVLYMFMTRRCRLEECGTTIIMRKSMCWMYWQIFS